MSSHDNVPYDNLYSLVSSHCERKAINIHFKFPKGSKDTIYNLDDIMQFHDMLIFMRIPPTIPYIKAKVTFYQYVTVEIYLSYACDMSIIDNWYLKHEIAYIDDIKLYPVTRGEYNNILNVQSDM